MTANDARTEKSTDDGISIDETPDGLTLSAPIGEIDRDVLDGADDPAQFVRDAIRSWHCTSNRTELEPVTAADVARYSAE